MSCGWELSQREIIGAGGRPNHVFVMISLIQ